MPSQWVPFLGVVALITASPGPDTALVVRNAIRHGPRAGVSTASGSAAGLVVWGATSAAGLTALLAASTVAYGALKLLGAAYLIVLGARLLWGAHRADPRPDGVAVGAAASPHAMSDRSAFRQGVTTNLLNPKAAVFFTALLPQFVGPHDPLFSTTLLFALTAAAASWLGLSAYACCAARAAGVFLAGRLRRLLDGLTGAALVGLGARLAFDNR